LFYAGTSILSRATNCAFAYKAYFCHRYHSQGSRGIRRKRSYKSKVCRIGNNWLKIGTKQCNAMQYNLALSLADLMKYN
jgi:hypothetical protein